MTRPTRPYPLVIPFLAVLACGLVLGWAPAAAAASPTSSASVPRHPLGNFSVNRYSGLVIAPGELRVDHVEDLAEIPAAQAKPELDAKGAAAWAAARCTEVAGVLHAQAGGRPLAFRPRSSSAALRPGLAGLPTLRFECALAATMPGAAKDGGDLSFRDDGVTGTYGWREITARGDRMTLTAADVPAASRSDRLTRYPAGLLSSPLDQRTASLRVRPGGPALADQGSAGPGGLADARGVDALTRSFTELVGQRRFTLGFALLAFVIAVALGALHALAPGHGKTIMAAYAASKGRRARRDVLTLGVTVTVTHTAGVLVLGMFIASGAAFAADGLYAWLGMASGALVAVVGLTLLRRALRSGPGHQHGHGHGHGHMHHHAYGHDQGHGHGHESHTHGHAAARNMEESGSGRQDHVQDSVLVRDAEREAPDTNPQDTNPPDGDPAPDRPRRGRTALMGFAGGMVPSPSAVLVLVGAAATGRAWFGVVLVLAYGVGLAATLVLVGLLVVGSGRALGRRLSEIADRFSAVARLAVLRGGPHRLMPIGSSAAVVLLGLGLIARSLPAAIG